LPHSIKAKILSSSAEKKNTDDPYYMVLLKMVGPTIQNGDLSRNILHISSTKY